MGPASFIRVLYSFFDKASYLPSNLEPALIRSIAKCITASSKDTPNTRGNGDPKKLYKEKVKALWTKQCDSSGNTQPLSLNLPNIYSFWRR
jgi:hypothetical protein